MSENRDALAKERLQLQNEYREYNARNGFDYRAYLNPPPGHFYQRYKQRIAEIDAVLAPELKYYPS